MPVRSGGAPASYRRRLDPEIAAHIAGLDAPDLHDIAGTRARRLALWRAAAATRPRSPRVEREDRLLLRTGEPPVPVRVYRPDSGRLLGCLLWIHGGGHVLGSLEQDDLLCEHIADAVGVVVVSVEWRRAPEHTFPAALDDCTHALRWVAGHADELRVPVGALAIGGASSGAGTAAAVALRARDEGAPAIRFQLLIYPMLDDRNDTASARSVTDPLFWNYETNALAWRLYLGGEAPPEANGYAAPARADDLSGLPPAFVAVGALDMFLDEDVAYATRLAEAGVAVELHVYPGAPHAFDMLAPNAGVSLQLAGDRDRALRHAFAAEAER